MRHDFDDIVFADDGDELPFQFEAEVNDGFADVYASGVCLVLGERKSDGNGVTVGMDGGVEQMLDIDY